MSSFRLVGHVSGSKEVSEVGDDCLKKIARSGKNLILLLASLAEEQDKVHKVLVAYPDLDDLIRFCIIEQNSLAFGTEMACSIYEISFDRLIDLSQVVIAKLRNQLDFVIGLEKFLPIGYFKLLQIMVGKMNDIPEISPDIAKLF